MLKQKPWIHSEKLYIFLVFRILDPTKGLLYDFYKTQYGDILYSWGFLEERLELLKTSASQPNQELSALSLTCGTCFEAYQDSWCANCKRQKLKCALCRSGVKGPAALCVTCGHGGHTQHMKLWFETETECASGCGCKCLTTNTEERWWGSHFFWEFSCESVL